MTSLLWWALAFLIVAIVAGIFGFGFIAGAASVAAKVLFFIFVVAFLIFLITALARRAA